MLRVYQRTFYLVPGTCRADDRYWTWSTDNGPQWAPRDHCRGRCLRWAIRLLEGTRDNRGHGWGWSLWGWADRCARGRSSRIESIGRCRLGSLCGIRMLGCRLWRNIGNWSISNRCCLAWSRSSLLTTIHIDYNINEHVVQYNWLVDGRQWELFDKKQWCYEPPNLYINKIMGYFALENFGDTEVHVITIEVAGVGEDHAD